MDQPGCQFMDHSWDYQCIAKPEVPPVVIRAAIKHLFDKLKRTGGKHDTYDRTGIFQKGTIYLKSYVLADYTLRKLPNGKTESACTARGYVNAEGVWVDDPKYDKVKMFTNKILVQTSTHVRFQPCASFIYS